MFDLILTAAKGRVLPFVTVCDFSDLATCYAGPNGQDRPEADISYRYSMGKKWPPRPTKDFRIASFQMIIEIEATHRRAGFSEIRYGVIQRRFWQLLSFLDRQGYRISQHQTSVEDVGPGSDLMNSDLNDDGYLFIQRYLDKWHGRLYKDKGAEAEWRFLEKWHCQFVADRLNSINVVATD